jgi:hypothetical protein
MTDMKVIGLLCLIAGALLFVRQIVRFKKGKTTSCDCGNLFPSKCDKDKKDQETK